MRKKSHLSLAGYIVDIVDADMIDHPLAFRFGSLEPDLVPSFITTKHRIDLTFHKLEKKINKVIDEYDKNKGLTSVCPRISVSLPIILRLFSHSRIILNIREL